MADVKEPFKFEYTMPSLDWYETIERTVMPDDFCSFARRKDEANEAGEHL